MAEVAAVAQNLLALNEDELLAQLGAQLQIVEVSPRAASLDALEEMNSGRPEMGNLQRRKLVIPATHPGAAGVEDEKPSSQRFLFLQ
jgi:hypothetical protein